MKNGLKNKSLLIIEDEDDLVDLYLTVLKEAGVKRIDTAKDGKIGLKKYLDSRDYDLIQTGIMLPQIDGLEVLKTIKGEDSDSRIVMCTDLYHKEIINEAFALGAEAYIVKSEYDPGQYANFITSLLDGTVPREITLEGNLKRIAKQKEVDLHDDSYKKKSEGSKKKREVQLKVASEQLDERVSKSKN